MENSHATADYPDRRMRTGGIRRPYKQKSEAPAGEQATEGICKREMIVFKVEPEPCGAFNSPLIRWQLEGIPEEQIGTATSQHGHLNLNRFNVCLEQLLNRYVFFFFLGPGGENTAQVSLKLV